MTENDREATARARLGHTLGDKWTLESLLGVGAMAAVYAGKHRNGAKAAIKVLHPHIARSKDLRERFLREGYAANKVEHTGVAKVLDDEIVASGPDEGTAYLVMELLEGQSLEDRLLDGPPISQGGVMELARAVLDVLEAAHKHGVVHRDLKPENLFLSIGETGVGKVKVLDFGLARISDDAVRTLSGQAMGTPSYMPPEQAAGRIHEIDGRADLFALAATCFRVLTGRTVHPGMSVAEIVLTMAREKAPKIRTLVPTLSPDVAHVIDRALEYKREDRYADAAAMRVDVDAALAALKKGGLVDSIIRLEDILEVVGGSLAPPPPLEPTPPIDVDPPPTLERPKRLEAPEMVESLGKIAASKKIEPPNGETETTDKVDPPQIADPPRIVGASSRPPSIYDLADESIHPAGVPRANWVLRIGVVAALIGGGAAFLLRPKPAAVEQVAPTTAVADAAVANAQDANVQDANMQTASIEMPDVPAIADAGIADAAVAHYVSPKVTRPRPSVTHPSTTKPPKKKPKR